MTLADLESWLDTTSEASQPLPSTSPTNESAVAVEDTRTQLTVVDTNKHATATAQPVDEPQPPAAGRLRAASPVCGGASMEPSLDAFVEGLFRSTLTSSLTVSPKIERR